MIMGIWFINTLTSLFSIIPISDVSKQLFVRIEYRLFNACRVDWKIHDIYEYIRSVSYCPRSVQSTFHNLVLIYYLAILLQHYADVILYMELYNLPFIFVCIIIGLISTAFSPNFTPLF
jgi:hypothetical protein